MEKAKLLDINEVLSNRPMEDGCIWIELEDGILTPAFFDIARDAVIASFIGPAFAYRYIGGCFRVDEYGKTWRCWSDKPDEEQMITTLWNE